MDASISCDQVRRVRKDLLMVGHRLYGLSMPLGTVENLRAGHDPCFHLNDDDMPPEFDQCAPDVSRDDPRAGFEEAERFFARGHLLAFQHTPPRPGHHLLNQRQRRLRLSEETLRLPLGLGTQHTHHASCLAHHRLDPLDELLIQLFLLSLLLFGFAPQMPVQDLWGLPSGTQT
jgi:hypothetical protein